MNYDLTHVRQRDSQSEHHHREHELKLGWIYYNDFAGTEKIDDLTASEKEDIRKFYSDETPKYKSNLKELFDKLND